jgi:WhiB family redox-sensing transcriptional regulator
MDTDWRFRAECRTEEPELFFPVGTSGPALDQTARATAVCRRCPVMNPCRDWALMTGQATGVWGGMTEDQRRAARLQDPLDLPVPRNNLSDAAHARSRSEPGLLPDHLFNALGAEL